MTNFRQSVSQNLSALTNDDALLDALIEVEGFFDNFHLYAYDNWIEGEVVAGPKFNRYWVKVILLYYKGDMPDPLGAMSLAKHGCKVRWKKSERKQSVDVEDSGDLDDRRKAKMELVPIWLVEIKIPRRFIDGFDDMEDQEVEDEIDLSAVEEAEDDGAEADEIGDGDIDLDDGEEEGEDVGEI